MAKVYHSEIFGLRETKYNWLNKHNIDNVKWKKIFPRPEFYLFIPTDNKLANHYYSFNKITDIFPVNSVGVVTARDSLTIGWTKEEIWKRIQNFMNLDNELAREAYKLGKDTRDWKVELAKKDLKESGPNRNKLVPILYRPFDIRFTYYTGNSRGFHCMPREDVMQYMLDENIGLCIGRQSSVIGSENYDIVFVSRQIVDLNLFRRGGELVFPLYIYRKVKPKKTTAFTQLLMFEPEVEYGAILPNINTQLIEKLSEEYRAVFLRPDGKRGEHTKEYAPKQIFYYIYAILYSNSYRAKYSEFLKIDFPRIPFTKDFKLFLRLAELGEKLADFHTLNSPELNSAISQLNGNGNNKVEKPRFVSKGRVYINEEQYFNNVPEEVWQYKVGGYQVCEKWLKDRKDRILNSDEIKTYCKIVTALSNTIKLQKEIDKYYPKVEENIIQSINS